MKTQTAFRLDNTLLTALKEQAKLQNRSLNNYVEFVLQRIIAQKPNSITQKAIEDARNDVGLGLVEDIDQFIDSI